MKMIKKTAVNLFMQIFLTGHSGFVGQNIVYSFKKHYLLRYWTKGTPFDLEEDDYAVIHLAGKAHDLKSKVEPEDYYKINTELTKQVFDAFLNSHARIFIMFSSVKAVADHLDGSLDELHVPNPISDYGKSKLLAEQYICSREWPPGKRVYILRPCMIHGPGNKGNLNLLYKFVKKGLPYPLASFNNKRSFLSIENLIFLIEKLLTREDIPSGIYNVCDTNPVSTNELIELIGNVIDKKPKLWLLPQTIVKLFSRLGDWLHLPLNTDRLHKLTQNFVVDNAKIRKAIGTEFPVEAKTGLRNTIISFKTSVPGF